MQGAVEKRAVKSGRWRAGYGKRAVESGRWKAGCGKRAAVESGRLWGARTFGREAAELHVIIGESQLRQYAACELREGGPKRSETGGATGMEGGEIAEEGQRRASDGHGRYKKSMWKEGRLHLGNGVVGVLAQEIERHGAVTHEGLWGKERGVSCEKERGLSCG